MSSIEEESVGKRLHNKIVICLKTRFDKKEDMLNRKECIHDRSRNVRTGVKGRMERSLITRTGLHVFSKSFKK